MTESSLRGLSMWQPWAGLLAQGIKKFETRPWHTSWKGDVAICSTKGGPSVSDAEALLQEMGLDLTDEQHALCGIRGCALAVVRFGRIHSSLEMTLSNLVSRQELAMGNYEPGRYAWEVVQAELLRQQYAINGRQRLWRVGPEDAHQIRNLLGPLGF